MAANPRVITAALAAAITIASALASDSEGLRYTAYPDPAGGPWTICEGHTKGVKQGDRATLAQCAEYKRTDLLEASDTVGRCITWPLSANQRGAFIDAAFNIGPSVVCGSTLQRKANAGDIEGACRELLRWDHAGGKQLRGLTIRRRADLAVCWPHFSNVIH